MVLAATMASIVIILSPVPPQCQDPVYARVNPGLCDLHSSIFPDFPSTGGGGSGGGLIGRILHAIGGLL